MVLDPIPESLPVHFFGSRPQPPTSQWDLQLEACYAFLPPCMVISCVTDNLIFGSHTSPHHLALQIRKYNEMANFLPTIQFWSGSVMTMRYDASYKDMCILICRVYNKHSTIVFCIILCGGPFNFWSESTMSIPYDMSYKGIRTFICLI